MAVLKEKTYSTAIFANIPEVEIVDRGFKECGFEQIVFADENSADIEKNDFNGFFYDKQTPSDTCDFFLVDSAATDHALNDGTYGTYLNFGDNSSNVDLTWFVVDWKKVLSGLGAGKYQVKKSITIAGITVDILSNHFTLKQYTTHSADKTWRMDIVMNGQVVHYETDFADSNYFTSVRARGFFGNTNPEYIKSEFISKNNNRKITNDIRVEDSWVLQSELLPECITKEIFYFMLLADDKYITDYNRNNHRYDLKRVPVDLEEQGGVDYFSQIRNARLNLTFTDRFLNKEKKNC